MQQKLQVALIQSNLVWENPKQNRILFTEKISKISKPTDIIILPEMFTTGFSMNASNLAETMQGETVNWMLEMAKNNNVAIVGSLIIKEDGKYYNRLLFVSPEGKIASYNKRHTFTLAGENKVYQAGTKKVIIHYKGWKICPLICYDLRFPVWARNTENYDVLLYVANWPKPRIEAWNALLKARAIENMSYCIGLNRVGIDANNYEYTGHSIVYNAIGESISKIPINKEETTGITLDKTHLETTRNRFKFLEDRDAFILK